MDDAARVLDGMPDDLPAKHLLAVTLFGLWLLVSLAVYFAPEPEG